MPRQSAKVATTRASRTRRARAFAAVNAASSCAVLSSSFFTDAAIFGSEFTMHALPVGESSGNGPRARLLSEECEKQMEDRCQSDGGERKKGASVRVDRG